MQALRILQGLLLLEALGRGGSGSGLYSWCFLTPPCIHAEEGPALPTLVVHESGRSTLRESVSESQAGPGGLNVERVR